MHKSYGSRRRFVVKTGFSISTAACWLLMLLPTGSVRADSWTYWGQVNTPVTNNGSVVTQMATDGTNFYYATLVYGVWRASISDPAHTFTEMPMTGFPLWDANTNTNGFAAWYLATTPQGSLVLAGSVVNISNNAVNYDPPACFTNTLPVFYWWDGTNQLWQPASVTGKSYPYTAVVGNFSVAPDGSLWACSGFEPYAYRSTDGGHSYTAFDIDAGVPSNYFPMPLTGDTSFGDVFAVIAGPNNQTVIGTETGGYLQTTNNGLAWTSLDPNFTNANSVNPLGRVGNATITGLDRYGDFLGNNIEFVAAFPGLSTWSGVTLIGYRPADGSYYAATNGLPTGYTPLSVTTPPSGESFTFVNQNPALTAGIYRSPDGRNWTQFNTGISALNSPTGRAPGIHTASLSNLVFVSVGGAIYDYDSSPPPITNRPPVALPQNVNLVKNTPTNFTLSGSDADGDALNFAVATPPVNGVLGGAAPNLTYTPSNNFTGTDRLFFTVNDSKATSAAVVVNFSVNSAANPAPAISFTGPANGSSSVTPATIVLSAIASATGGIQQVNFYNGTNLLAAIATPPYTFTWTNPACADYTLNAFALGEAGAGAWALPVTISILPAAPVLGIQQVDTAHAAVTWPLALEGFYLEMATNANGPWILSPYPPLAYPNGQIAMIPIAGQQFFQIMHPQ